MPIIAASFSVSTCDDRRLGEEIEQAMVRVQRECPPDMDPREVVARKLAARAAVKAQGQV